MNNYLRIGIAILLSLGLNTAYAYGSTSSSSHCDRPVFSNFQPPVSKYLQSFDEFSFIASANTTPTSIHVTITAGQTKYEFSPKELQISSLNNSHLTIRGKLDRPLQGGFARLSVTAHSKPGCEKTDGILIRIH